MVNTVDLRQYLGLGLKWSWLIMLLTGIAAAAGYLNSQRQPPVYVATATIMVGQSFQVADPSTQDMSISERLAQTYANIARREPVLAGVVNKLGLERSWQSLRSQIQVSQVANTQLLEIATYANSPEEAKTIANEVVNQLILLSPTALQNQTETDSKQFIRGRLIKDLQAKIEAGQSQLEVLKARMSEPLPAERLQELQAEINNLEGLIAGWASSYAELVVFVEGERSPNYLVVIESAQASSSPLRPQPFNDGLMAGAVGLLLALSIAFFVEYLDDRIKSAEELSQLLGLTALGRVGTLKGKNFSDRLISNGDLLSPLSEAYRMIRSNIQFMCLNRSVKSLMITSPTPGEGRSTTVANLGVVMAQAGLKTVIVDSDLRRPTQHEIFQIANVEGLTDSLRYVEPNIARFLRRTQVENLYLLTSGTLPLNPSELLGSPRMKRLQDALSDWADLVLYDSPPVLAVTDAVVLSNRVDGVVLITQAKKTRLGAVRQAVSHLQQAGGYIIGSVLNRAGGKLGRDFYDYQQYYSSGGGSAPPRAPSTVMPPKKPQSRWAWLSFLGK